MTSMERNETKPGDPNHRVFSLSQILTKHMQFGSPLVRFLKSPEFVCCSTVDAIISSSISLSWYFISLGWLLVPSGSLGFLPHQAL